MDEREGIAWWRDGAVGRIELRRPERANTLGRSAALALARAIDDLLLTEPGAVLLTAQGAVFCGGGDIDEFTAAADTLDTLVADILKPLHPAIERLALAPLPVVSAISGSVGGAGVGLALCADFVLAAEHMKLRTGYAAIGLSPDVGSSYFLARRVGGQRAKQWLMLSEPVDAQVCLAQGAVDALYPAAELGPEALALAHRLANGARDSLVAIKSLCEGWEQRSLSEHLALEQSLLSERARSAEAREGIQAFVQKRSPGFGGD